MNDKATQGTTPSGSTALAPAGGSAAPLPIPTAVYPCRECKEDYSWPAEDLFWSAKCEAWICDNCWDNDEHGEPGIRLDREIKRQNAEVSDRAAEPNINQPAKPGSLERSVRERL